MNGVYAERYTYWLFNRRTVVEIQGKISELGKRSIVSRAFHVKNDKNAIAGWKRDLDRILQIFNVCWVIHVRQALKR